MNCVEGNCREEEGTSIHDVAPKVNLCHIWV